MRIDDKLEAATNSNQPEAGVAGTSGELAIVVVGQRPCANRYYRLTTTG